MRLPTSGEPVVRVVGVEHQRLLPINGDPLEFPTKGTPKEVSVYNGRWLPTLRKRQALRYLHL